jgi:hypothetical protein
MQDHRVVNSHLFKPKNRRWVVYGLMGGGTVSGDLFSKLLRKRGSILASTLR